MKSFPHLLIMMLITLAATAWGQSKPSIAEEMLRVIEKEGVSKAISLYQHLKKTQNAAYDFNVNQLNNLGFKLMNSERLDDAIAIYQFNAAQYPNLAITYDSLGDAYVAAGDLKRGMANYEKALSLQPENGWIWMSLARLHAKGKDKGKELTFLKKGIDQFQGRPEPYEFLAAAYGRYEMWDAQKNLFEKEVRQFPDTVDPWDKRLKTLAEQGNRQQAADLLKKALKKFPASAFWRSRKSMKALGESLPEVKDGWESVDAKTAVPQKSAMDALSNEVAEGNYPYLSNVTVAVKGKLVMDAYFNGSNRYRIHDTRSVGKSIASLLLGIAIDQGLVANEHAPVFEHFGPEYTKDPAKAGVTLHHLLTMSPGLDAFDDRQSPGNENTYQETSKWEEIVLNLEMAYKPGSQFVYNSASAMLVGLVLDEVTPKGLEVFAKKQVFDPLGINQYRWVKTPQKGKPYTAGGLRLTARDFAKIGQLYLDGGVWQGKRIVSKDWIERSTKTHIRVDEDYEYGYYWWRRPWHFKGKDVECYFASGNGGNKIIVLPELEAVVVITSTAYNRREGHPHSNRIMFQHILPALIGK